MKKNWQVRMKRILIFLLTLFVFVPGLSAQNLTVDAPNLVEVGESFNLSFVYDGSENVSDFNWNEGGDFLVVWPGDAHKIKMFVEEPKRVTKAVFKIKIR